MYGTEAKPKIKILTVLQATQQDLLLGLYFQFKRYWR